MIIVYVPDKERGPMGQQKAITASGEKVISAGTLARTGWPNMPNEDSKRYGISSGHAWILPFTSL